MSARKIMLLGDMGVGKTSIANRMAFDRFSASYKPTLGVELYTCDVAVDGTPLRLVLWDTDGDLQHDIIASTYCRGASAACVIGDLSRPATLHEARRTAGLFEDLYPGRPCALIGNKQDLVRPPDETEVPGSRLLDLEGVSYVTSAKNGDGVMEALRGVAERCMETRC